jgi:uncharacterized protein (DUF1778 family)
MPPKHAFQSSADKFLKDAVDRLSYRTDPDTSDLIKQAAQKSSMSVNAWMDSALKKAAKDVLGLDDTVSSLHSEELRKTIETDASIDLIRVLKPYLQEWDPLSVLQFEKAFQKMLSGMDGVKFLLNDNNSKLLFSLLEYIQGKPHSSIQFVTLLLLLIKEEELDSVAEFVDALKPFLRGLLRIKPFLKGEGLKQVLNVLAEVENFAISIEKNASQSKE